jgi:rod shape determining protein RodA
MMRLNWRRFDFVLLGATLVMLVFGVAMVYSATLGVENYEDYPLRQGIYGLIGLILLLAMAAFDYRLLTSLQWPVYVAVLGALGAVALVGQVRGGAAGWFDAGIVFIQPAEFSKILFTIVFAQYLASRHERLGRPQWVLGAFVLMALPAALIYMQPDLGQRHRAAGDRCDHALSWPICPGATS